MRERRSDYRVIETTGLDGVTWLTIRKCWYEPGAELPIRIDADPCPLAAVTGDGLVLQLDELARALTRPSIIHSEVRGSVQ